jgi:DNA-binding response OmpR family regulator
MRIAVLDDDHAQLEFATEVLRAVGHTCTVFTKARALIHRLQRETFDLVTLDWNIGDMQGDEVLAWIRQNCITSLPVLFMTGRSCESDMIDMLNAGADDYLVKPVSAPVLIARITSLLRRAYQHEQSTTRQQFDDYDFDLQTLRAFHRGVHIPLSQKEFQLALLFFRNFARELSRAHILETVWKHSPGIPTRTLDTHVSAIRVKLDLRPQNGYCIIPIYGYGYRLERLGMAKA